jgi:hypothetical protein
MFIIMDILMDTGGTPGENHFYSEFNAAFFLTLAGAIFGFGGLCLQAILKSRCKEFSCCGVHCVRDPAPPGQEPELEQKHQL